ncbi:Aminotransferase class V [Klebsormidium nitens]|uniref:alanine--glyoxylate transaminase n=1 Tax=Klebsormidium nitens TaxID=105231 RepID=A0A1Y1HYF7_KLENI|nr:Aminotransferase class V [Klebsormidium nitens]|eukprot:GAQ83213.1 Aminotransferase class V [Klebsormidium nitens]
MEDGALPMLIAPPALSTAPLEVPHRLLMGPGPSNVPARVLAAAGLPLLGHMHPQYLKIMDECQAWLRYAFQTTNELTLAVSGSGHAAMEAGIANLVEAGDPVLVAENGLWGERVSDIADRYGAEVKTTKVAGGEVFTLGQIEEELRRHRPKLLFLCHGDSSTGALQPLVGMGELCHKYGCLLFVDCITTIGGVPVFIDKWGIDVAYTGAQKVLNVPPGASPITFSPRAVQRIASRHSKVGSFYLDMTLVGRYWGVGGPRIYHHTGLISNVYVLREGLALLAEEGLEAAWARHRQSVDTLHAGLERMGLQLFVKEKAHRLPTVSTVCVPAGVKWDAVSKFIMEKYSMEIAGGLGPTAGKVWRIGLMGANANPANVTLVLAAMEDALRHVGFLRRSAL